MDHFNYKNGELFAENVAVAKIAAEVGTPCYIYSSETLRHHFTVLNSAFDGLNPLICFALKSNSNFAVIKTLAQAGAGVDVVSEGEIRRALACGVLPSKMIFSGVGKTAAEMRFALENDIFQFNVESAPELELLNKVAGEMGVKARIAIRVNPDVDAATHGKITTGLKTSKFGIDIDVAPQIFAQAAAMPNIDLQGVSVHIGSQITDLQPFEDAFLRLKEFVAELEKVGHKIHTIDLGGGLGIPYELGKVPPEPAAYAQIVKDIFADFAGKLIFEPGRVITGNAGILISEVIYVKSTAARNFLIVDAAMNDLIRPSYYDAHHDIIPVIHPPHAKPSEVLPQTEYDIVGPVCETGDTFAQLRALPELKAGDLIAFRSAGAYGAVMASTYNSRLMVAEVMVHGSEYAVTSRRQSYEEMFEREQIPSWLK